MNALQFSEVRGTAQALDAQLMLKVEEARPHSLLVRFDQRERVPDHGARFERLTLLCAGRVATLGPCAYEAGLPLAPEAAPPDGRLVFLEQVYDFSQLFASGRISELSQKVRQLPLVWGRKSSIQPAFKDFTSQLLYELQVYRALFDGLDRTLSAEPYEVREAVHKVAITAEYANFSGFIDRQLHQLDGAVRHFTKLEHERHGFFFRKQLSDVIAASEFLSRTNLKPRGYAGDSLMMRMVYEREFKGSTLFSKFMHRHPIETAAAQAVRNRRALVAKAIHEVGRRLPGPGRKTRVLSVACGPLWELHDVLPDRDALERHEFVLLDQDPLALADAQGTILEVEQHLGGRVAATLVRDSVRTMLRTADLSSRWGHFDFIYSMGLFDYLTEPVAKAVIAKLYEALAPGGELLIGNFHTANPSRIYMEYWMDWVIYYRDEDEFRQLAEELPGATSSVFFEETGSQMFLSVRKP